MQIIEYGITNVDRGECAHHLWSLAAQADGGLLRTEGELDLSPGDGIMLELHLGAGGLMQFSARVRWVRDGAAWVDFTDLCTSERREFSRWLRTRHNGGATEAIGVELRRKYRVRRHGSALSVWIGGRLNEGESRELDEAVKITATHARIGALAVFIDVREYEPSAADSLAHIRDWLAHLVARGTLLGVVAGGHRIGTMQFGRLVREANAADSLVMFEDIEAACSAWRLVSERVEALTTAARSGLYARPRPALAAEASESIEP